MIDHDKQLARAKVRWVSLDELKKLYPEPIRYPEEVKMNGIKTQLRRVKAKKVRNNDIRQFPR